MQGLHRPLPVRSPAQVARDSGGIQAQDQRAARLGFRARDAALTATDVDRARTEDRSLLRAWVMRRTVHLIATEDAEWMLPLYAPKMAGWNHRRLAHFGFDAAKQERAIARIEAMLVESGPLTRTEIVADLTEAGFEINVQIRTHLMYLVTAEGIACMGPDRGSEACLILARDWIDPPEAGPDREKALAELARRYMAGFGPATDHDLAKWAGIGLREASAALSRIGSELVEVRVDGQRNWASARLAPLAASSPAASPLRLLPAFDNYVLGHQGRDFIATGPEWKQVSPGGGIVRAAILDNGVAVGTWGVRRAGEALQVELSPFGELSGDQIPAIEAEVADIGRFEARATALAGP